ncbi:MAG TPA: pyridoxamine 5'-phosphate oxidase family protein [Dermatophilaceae bacterium]|nr:pyridoxamine 5'-phosphate oxidase family protein [Dermatophilaceae bacterium]
MRLTEDEARRRLAAYDHGVLATVHPRRGADAVPVVYAVAPGGFVGIPIDRVKPKASGPLQRERNLMADPRATLLVDHWDPADWTRLWWVRAQLRWETTASKAPAKAMSRLLADRYPQYRDQPFDRVLIFRVVALTGWSAGQG